MDAAASVPTVDDTRPSTATPNTLDKRMLADYCGAFVYENGADIEGRERFAVP